MTDKLEFTESDVSECLHKGQQNEAVHPVHSLEPAAVFIHPTELYARHL